MCSTYPQTFQQDFCSLSTGLRRHDGEFSSTSNIVELACCSGNSSASNLCGSTYPKSTNVSTSTLKYAAPTLVSSSTSTLNYDVPTLVFSSTSYLSRNFLSPFASKSAWTKPRADHQCRFSLVQYPSSVFSGMPYYKVEVSFFMNYIDAPPQVPDLHDKNIEIDNSVTSSDEDAEIFDVVNEESSGDEQAGLIGVVKKSYHENCDVDCSDDCFKQLNSSTIELSSIPICDESSESEQESSEVSKPWYYDFDELVDIVTFLGSVDRVYFFGLGRASVAPAEPVEIQALVSDVDSTLEPGFEDIEDDNYLTFEELLDIVHFLGLAPKSTPVRKLTWAEHLSIQKVAPKKEASKNKTTILRKAVRKIDSIEAPVKVPAEVPSIIESKDSEYYFDLPFSSENLKDIEEFYGLDEHFSLDELVDIVQFLGLAPTSTPVRKLTWAEHLGVQKVVPRKEIPLKNKTTILRKAVPKIVTVQVEAPPMVESKDSDYYFDLPFSSEDLDDFEDKCLSFDELVDIVQFLGLSPKSTPVQKLNGAEHLSPKVETNLLVPIETSEPWYYDFDELVGIVNFLELVYRSDSFGTQATCPQASVESHNLWYSDFDELVDIVHLLGFGPAQLECAEITTPWYSDFDELVDIVHLLGFGPAQSESVEISIPWYSDFDELVGIVHLLGFGPAQSESVEISTPWYSDFDELVGIVHLLGFGTQLSPVPKKTWAEHLSIRKVPTTKAILSKKSTILGESLQKSGEIPVPVKRLINKSLSAKISNQSNPNKSCSGKHSPNESTPMEIVCNKPPVNHIPEKIQVTSAQTLKPTQTWANHLAIKRVSKVKYMRIK
ncbi:hypothetical protein CAAN4_B09164 [[Candida] anglica]|uniref:Uncharacterized protein n=1 Tax=[Candida] anglica TaxID=148631 RepID=A0ABP0E805_9ASCO